jgi:hypothetical protein
MDRGQEADEHRPDDDGAASSGSSVNGTYEIW